MLPPCNNELWFILLYCLISWLFFSLALYVADSFRRAGTAMAGGFLTLVTTASIATLAAYAAAELRTSLEMTGALQVVGVAACSLAVSRVCQLQSWGRTLVSVLLSVLGYLLSGILLLWLS